MGKGECSSDGHTKAIQKVSSGNLGVHSQFAISFCVAQFLLLSARRRFAVQALTSFSKSFHVNELSAQRADVKARAARKKLAHGSE
jgi:hypothetical protein